jgi:hypothetical protein
MNGRARLQTFFTNETRVPRDGGGPPARAPLPALPARTMPRRRELGHYDDYHDRHPRNGSAPCLDDALLRAPLTPSTSRERSTARLGPHPAGARTLRRLPRPGGTELCHVPLFDSAVQPPGLSYTPPHYYRDPAHGPGVGSRLLPRVTPPTCSRPVSSVGLGPFVMRLLCCSLPAPARRQFFALRFVTVCH